MKSPFSSSVRLKTLMLIAVSALIYANTLFNGFTIDDFFAYANNGFVHDLRNLPHLFTREYFGYSNEASYRPVCTLTYFMDAALWGNWPGGPHLHNVFLYVLVVLVFFFLCRTMLPGGKGAFPAALVFAVHPVHTEVVNNIAFREDLLVALLLPLAWLLYRRGRKGRMWLWLPAALAAYFMALLSKESAVIFPALLILLEWGGGRGVPECGSNGVTECGSNGVTECGSNGVTECGSVGVDGCRAGRWRRDSAAFMAGIVLLTGLFLFIRFRWMQFPGEADQPRLGGSLSGTLLADVKIQARYWGLFFWPFRLSALYPPEMYSPGLDPVLWLSLSFLLVVPVLFVIFRRSRPLVTGILWWYICLAPTANIYPIFNPMAERYMFLASMGPCWIAGHLWSAHIRDRWRRGDTDSSAARKIGNTVITALLVLWLSASAVTVVRRNRDWRDNMSLWTSTARIVPDNPTVISNLAAAYYERGDFAGVIQYAQEALDLRRRGKGDLNPAATYVALAGGLQMQGQTDRALEYLLEAEKLIPARFDIDTAIYRNIGLIYDAREELETALSYYLRAAEIDPFRPGLWRKISFCRLRLGDRVRALQDWTRARELDKSLPTFEKIEQVYRQSLLPKVKE